MNALIYSYLCVHHIHLYTIDPFLQFQPFHLSRVFVSSEMRRRDFLEKDESAKSACELCLAG